MYEQSSLLKSGLVAAVVFNCCRDRPEYCCILHALVISMYGIIYTKVARPHTIGVSLVSPHLCVGEG